MSWRPLFRREITASEPRQELESYLEMVAEDFAARGMNPAEARRAARIKLGNLTRIEEDIYMMNTPKLIDACVRHTRHTLRTLRRNPVFAGTAILTLALAIGANTAVFMVVNSVLLKPLLYPNPDQLVELRHVAPGAPDLASVTGALNLSASMFFTYSEQNSVFQAMGIWIPATAAVTGVGGPEQVRMVAVSSGTLEALNVQPALGRLLLPADQALSSPETVMLDYGYWQRHFGGDRSVIGRSLIVDSRPRVIAGVMPVRFRIADTPFDLILPFRFDRSRLMLAGFAFQGIGRLKPGVSVAQAEADLRQLLPVWMHSWPSLVGEKAGDPIATSFYRTWRIAPALRPLREAVVGTIGTVLWVVMGTLGIVMLIAGANVANLLLVRAAGRRQEMGVRAALGADRGRLTRELLGESMALALMGGALGTALAYAGLRLLVWIGPANLPRLGEISLDPHALAFTVALAVLAGFLFGLIPAMKLSAPGISTSLRSEGRNSTATREHNRTRGILVAVQVALALVLLIGSTLMIRSFQALRRVDPGFSQPARMQIFRVTIPNAMVPAPEMVVRTENAILEKLRVIPGVTSAAFASSLPMDGLPHEWDGAFKEGQNYVPSDPTVMRDYVNVSPGFFHTAGTHLIAGREFDWNDIYSLRNYVLISDNLASEWWVSASAAVGKRLRSGPTAPWREVIGVVQNVRSRSINEPAPATIYEPVMERSPLQGNAVIAARSVAFVVRSDQAGTAGLLDEVERAVWSINAGLPLEEPSTMQTIYDHSMSHTSFTLVMLGIAGGMALVLGIIGIYGVIAYTVAQRRRDVGIRMGLGARVGTVTWMFVRYGLALSCVGIVAGAVAAAGLSRLMSSLLFGVTALDPVTYASTALILLAAAIGASYIPARRAAAGNPLDALRGE